MLWMDYFSFIFPSILLTSTFILLFSLFTLHLRWVFFSNYINFYALNLDISSKQILHMWSLPSFLPSTNHSPLGWFIEGLFSDASLQFALRGDPSLTVTLWRSKDSSTNNFVFDKRTGTGSRSEPCLLAAVAIQENSRCGSLSGWDAYCSQL